MRINSDSRETFEKLLKVEFDRIDRRDSGKISSITELESVVTEVGEKFRLKLLEELQTSESQLSAPQKKTAHTVASSGSSSAIDLEPS
jgi:uncharacterized membrane protein